MLPVALPTGGDPWSRLTRIAATTGNVTAAFAALSYGDAFTVTVVADPDHVPDLPLLTEALQAELDLLG